MLSIAKAKHYVHANGVLWERALWDYLFDGGSLEQVHRCLLCYKNEDGGWGHGFEHDIKCPASNPLQVEFLLSVIRDTGLPAGNLLEGTVSWIEQNRSEDGSLKNPPGLLDYPHAPWWSGGGQNQPDSITGNLLKLGLCSPTLAESTQRWVLQNLSLEKIKANDWLFMAYHAHDYFMNVEDFPDLERCRQATLDNIRHCAEAHLYKGELNKARMIFQFAPRPESPVARAMPAELIERLLDHLAGSQREDGGWADEHGLAYWQPYFSTIALLTLKNYNRL